VVLDVAQVGGASFVAVADPFAATSARSRRGVVDVARVTARRVAEAAVRFCCAASHVGEGPRAPAALKREDPKAVR